MYWEDADYCTRVRQLGYKNVVASKSATYHRVGCAAGKYTALTTYYPLRNRLLYGKKHIFGWKRFIFGTYSLILFFQKVGAIILGRLFRQRLGPLERMRAVPMAYYDSLRGRYGKRV
jgi:GT2 family glycosyltransferase